MKQRKIAMGPGAASIILIVVVLSLSILAMLSLMTAKNDVSLSVRSAEMIRQVYELSSRSEESLAKLDAVLLRCLQENPDREACLAAVEENLPEGMELDGDLVSWTETQEDGAADRRQVNRTLECTVRLLPTESEHRTEWVSHKLIVNEPEDEWEWS